MLLRADSRSAGTGSLFPSLSLLFAAQTAAGYKTVIFVSPKDIDFGVTPSYLALLLR